MLSALVKVVAVKVTFVLLWGGGRSKMQENDGTQCCGKMLLARLLEMPVSNYDGGDSSGLCRRLSCCD